MTSPIESPNGLTTNALTLNALTLNALTLNALTLNALTLNALTLNALTLNALTLNALTLNALTLNGATPAEIDAERLHRADARKLLKYVYGCAMPEGSTVDLSFSTEGDDGSTCDGGTLSADGLSCSYEPLLGAIGLAPEWGTPGGVCDETCQRWISACVLARTNAYGITVPLSIRGSHPALTTTQAEIDEFPLREGTYYGNIFKTHDNGDGTSSYTPTYNTCGGPGSNIPEVTHRFCSSSATSCIIPVHGTCACTQIDASAFPQSFLSQFTATDDFTFNVSLRFNCAADQHSCGGVDPTSGAMTDCFDETATPYPEAITVFLNTQPVCGNQVCELNENAVQCPTDCRPDPWVRRFTSEYAAQTSGTGVLSNGDVVVAGWIDSFYPVNLGGGVIIGLGNPQTVFMGRFTRDGSHLWSKGVTTPSIAGHIQRRVVGVVVAPDDTFYVYGTAGTYCGSNYCVEAWIQKFTGAGTLVWEKVYDLGDDVALVGQLTIDLAGNVYLVGGYSGTKSFGGPPLASFGRTDGFVLKLGPDGSFIWSKSFGATNPIRQDFVFSIAADANGRLGIQGALDQQYDWLAMLDASGNILWSKHLDNNSPQAVVFDPSGNLYVTGRFGGSSTDFGGGPIGGAPPELWLVKYSPAGNHIWSRRIGTGQVWQLVTDDANNLVVGGSFTGVYDFGNGTFDSGPYSDVFMTKYDTAGNHQWSKQFGGPLSENLGGFDAKHGRIVLTGFFQASFFFEQYLLTASVAAPPTTGNTGAWGDLFLASFRDPSYVGDTYAPTFVTPTSPLNAEATSANGAVVNYFSGAVDDVDGVIAANCVPAAGTLFALGTTTVTCNATDAHGNANSTSFLVYVADTIHPVVVLPAPIVVQATTANGATVSYTATATDAVGTPQPACDHAPGTNFPLGRTDVYCYVYDNAGNGGGGSFSVDVRMGFGGFMTPTVNQHFARSTKVRVEFGLAGASANITNATARFFLAPIVNGFVGTEQSFGNFAYSQKNHRYGYTLDTLTRAAGTWRIRADLRDGISHTVRIKLD